MARPPKCWRAMPCRCSTTRAICWPARRWARATRPASCCPGSRAPMNTKCPSPRWATAVAETEGAGKEGLTTHAGQWDLAIVDLFLRQGNGLGVLAACRARRPGQKIVVLSNYATPDVRMRCTQLGGDAVFDKSNEIDALVAYCVLHGSRSADPGTGPVLL